MLVIPTADGQEQPLPDLLALLSHTLILKTSHGSSESQNKVQTRDLVSAYTYSYRADCTFTLVSDAHPHRQF